MLKWILINVLKNDFFILPWELHLGFIMEIQIKAKKAKMLTDDKIRERLRGLSYSTDVLHAFNMVSTPDSASETISLGIVLMDIAWQISGNSVQSIYDLANAFFPIECFFLGTVYQDDLLDSQNMDPPRTLIKALGVPTCLIMGNILYCEGLLSLIELAEGRDETIHLLLDSAEKLVRHVMESEIFRRKHIGKILPKKEFFRIWRRLTPNRICIEIGGILGNSDKKEIQTLIEIGPNISLVSRIVKEISEMYGLKGRLEEKLRNKPPPLPVTLAYESATTSEKKELNDAVKRLTYPETNTMENSTDIQILIDLVAKYNSISTALEIHRDVVADTKENIAQISNSEHKVVLNRILGSEILPQHNSQKEKQN